MRGFGCFVILMFRAAQSANIISRPLIIFFGRTSSRAEIRWCTRHAAVASLLDLLHKPGIDIRILGGSLEQSLRMWEHLYPDMQRLARERMVSSARSSRRIELAGGGRCAVLTQSQRAVRGLRLQKLRCDEVELFKPDIWEAAQLVTRSRPADATWSAASGPRAPSVRPVMIGGAIDALSTHHAPGGLMQKILDDAERNQTPVVRWCVLDVLQKCEPERECATCPLWDECQGLAKTRCEGFIPIDDAITMKRRVSIETWESEMLCRRPAARNAVFARFDPAAHVREHPADGELSLAMDFGFSAPLVCLWIRTSPGRTYVIDEYVQPQRTMDEHVVQIRARSHGTPTHISCDPAGAGRNEQTGMSSVQVLRRAGFVVRYRKSLIMEGVEHIRTALAPASGGPSLFVHPRCKHLIRALQGYQYARTGGILSELPLKDGEHDHLIDALRYHFVNTPSDERGAGRY